ncbi:MAG: HIT domain-containing protein [Candidatus Krumholzibacteriia bacterium]|nr:HIT domain-containing protein [Candidatus Latescibacterota bacterium]
MEHLFTPWRRKYVVEGTREEGCVFCRLANSPEDQLLATEHWYLALNAFPYCSGHVMLISRHHLRWLGDLPAAAREELGPLLARVEDALRRAYRPEGMNLGVNFGRAGGAGIPDHLHVHLLPRWVGDTNFITTVGQTRVVPEDLADSFARLAAALAAPNPDGA